MIDENKLIECIRSSLNTGRETFPLDLIIECIEEQPKVGEWVPVNIRPTTEEDGIDMQEYPLFFDFPLPAVGQNILVSYWDGVHEDANLSDDGVWYYLDRLGDWADAYAWMPLPEPYKKEEE